VHGAGPQLNVMLERAGIEPRYADGIRVTDAETLAIARQVSVRHGQAMQLPRFACC
jgi:N-acetyl-gamma-glutamyl-phosphate reductase/acetylglutamate kinase